MLLYIVILLLIVLNGPQAKKGKEVKRFVWTICMYVLCTVCVYVACENVFVCVHVLCVSGRTGTVWHLLVCLLAHSLDCLFDSDAIVIWLYAFIEYKLVAHHQLKQHTYTPTLVHAHIVAYTQVCYTMYAFKVNAVTVLATFIRLCVRDMWATSCVATIWAWFKVCAFVCLCLSACVCVSLWCLLVQSKNWQTRSSTTESSDWTDTIRKQTCVQKGSRTYTVRR